MPPLTRPHSPIATFLQRPPRAYPLLPDDRQPIRSRRSLRRCVGSRAAAHETPSVASSFFGPSASHCLHGMMACHAVPWNAILQHATEPGRPRRPSAYATTFGLLPHDAAAKPPAPRATPPLSRRRATQPLTGLPHNHSTGSLMYTMPRLARARMSHTTPRTILRHATSPPPPFFTLRSRLCNLHLALRQPTLTYAAGHT